MYDCRMISCLGCWLPLFVYCAAFYESDSLRKQLRSPDRNVRFVAIRKIGQLGGKAKEAVPDLISVFESDEPVLRAAAALAIANIGPEARQAVPSLIRALRKRDEAVL